MSARTILVADDDDFTRTSVASMVQQFGHTVCGKASSVAQALAICHEASPAGAVIDLDFGEGPNGIDLAHGLRRLNPEIAIVLLTSYGDPSWMGVHIDPPTGTRYVTKSSVNAADVLGDALAGALDAPLASTPTTDDPRAPRLSDGQWEILRLVAAGLTNAEIARRRHLTEDAVNKAVTRLVKQLEIAPGAHGNARVLLAQAYNRLVTRG